MAGRFIGRREEPRIIMIIKVLQPRAKSCLASICAGERILRA
jgi:hypothetical protein